MTHGNNAATAPSAMFTAGEIIGLSIGLNIARTGGTCQAQVLLNGVAQVAAGETTDIDASNTTSNFVEISSPIAYSAGDTITAQTVTTSFGPTGADATLYIFCQNT